jgi:hypothetical protein
MKENVHEQCRMAATRPLLIYYAKVNGSVLRICRCQNEHQSSVKNVSRSIMVTRHGNWSQSSINDVGVAFEGERESDTLPARFWNLASTDCQRFLVLYVWYWIRDLAILMDTENIGSLSGPTKKQHAPCSIMKMRVNGAWMIFGLASWFMTVRYSR